MATLVHKPLETDLDSVLDLCHCIDKLKIKSLFNALAIPCLSKVTSKEAIFIWLADLLLKVALVDQWQLLTLLTEFKENIIDFSVTLDTSMVESSDKIPVKYLVFCDRKFVTITGRDNFLNLGTGECIDGLKTQYLESIQYNLTTLYMTRYLKLIYDKDNGNKQSDT